MTRNKILMFVVCLLGMFAARGQSGAVNVATDDTSIFMVVEHDPEFPGGTEAMFQYMAANMHYPDSEVACDGVVKISFIVEKDGSVSNVKAMNNLGAGCADEAVRVVSNMPKWKPGKQRGRKVRVQYILPIKFQQ